jgi:glycosyltransferase involved in cell wall biosynthesis
MRAGAVLRALAQRAEVHVLVRPIYGSVASELTPKLAAACTTLHVGMSEAPSLQGFDVVHVFRLTTLHASTELVESARSRGAELWLDIDELDSETFERFAQIHQLTGTHALADAARAQARAVRAIEERWLSRCDRIFAASTAEVLRADDMGIQSGGLLPNAIDLPSSVVPPPSDMPFSAMFVGNLSYFPNVDGARHLCMDILPPLRAELGGTTRCMVVGAGASPELVAAINSARAYHIGRVADVAPWYRRAHCAVIPLRVGGGSRIKILEGFAHGRPVVTTSIGGEGIDAADGEQWLVADTADAFAAQCARIAVDAGLADRLASNGRAFVERYHTIDAMASALWDGSQAPAR